MPLRKPSNGKRWAMGTTTWTGSSCTISGLSFKPTTVVFYYNNQSPGFVSNYLGSYIGTIFFQSSNAYQLSASNPNNNTIVITNVTISGNVSYLAIE